MKRSADSEETSGKLQEVPWESFRKRFKFEIPQETSKAIKWFLESIKDTAEVAEVGNYSKLCSSFMNVLDELFRKHPNYLKSNSFWNYLNHVTDRIYDSETFKDVLRIFSELCDELQRLILDPEAEDEDDKNRKGKKKKINIKDMSQKDKVKNIKKLDRFINDTQEQIHNYETHELSEDELDNHTVFTTLPRFRSKLVMAWKLRERLAGRSSSSMSAFSKPFRYKGTDNSEFNDLISNYYQAILNKVDQKYSGRKSTFDAGNFFTLEELEAFVQEKLPKISMGKNIIDVYTDLLEENRKRFKNQHSFEYYQNRGLDGLKDEDDFEDDSADQKLEEKLKENDRKSKEIVQKLKATIERMKKEAEDLGDLATSMIDVDNDRDGEEEEETGSENEEDFGLENL